MGDPQVLSGYCLLLPDPVVPDLNALVGAARAQFMDDMGRLGDAVKAATGAIRINYAVFGNLDPALHAHVVPRFADEPDHLRTGTPWSYDWLAAPPFDPQQHADLRERIAELIKEPK